MPVAAFSAAASLGGAALNANAAGNAAKAQQNASQQTISANNQLLGQVGNNVNPDITYGNQAGGALAGLLGIGGNPAQSQQAFQNYLGSTNYQFLLNQGEQGQAFLNAPNLVSGATGKSLINYAQGMAGNALQGYEGQLNNLQGAGLLGSNIYANTGTNLAAQNANARNLAAGAGGTAGLYGANAIGGALSGVGNLASSSFGSVQNAFNGINNILGGPGSATQQESAFGTVAGLF